MELTPIERKIKLQALLTIRKVFKNGIPEFNACALCFISSYGEFMDEVLYYKNTGEFEVRYEVYKDPITWKTETRSIKFTLPQYQKVV
jgi:hypothetical protein